MADQYFLKIDGIEGESQDEQHKGAIELASWSFGGTASGAPMKGVTGAGKFMPQDVQCTAKVSKASPGLFFACTSGKRLTKATITGRKGGDGRSTDYFTVTLSEVMISSYQESGTSGADGVMEQFSCTFAKIQLEYRPMNADGSLGDAVSATYDAKRARPTRARRR
jgi:type VI secretion system secreted protein Hcp